MHLKTFAIARAALTALLFGASAQATILNEYSNLAGWTAATAAGPVTQPFTGLSGANNNAAGVTISSVNYRGYYNESVGYRTDYGDPIPAEDFGTGSIMVGGSYEVAGNGLTIYDTGIQANLLSLSGIRSLSFNFSGWRNANGFPYSYSTVGVPITLRLQVYESNLPTSSRDLVIPAGSPGAGFFGFTTSGDISGIKLMINAPTSVQASRVALDNFAYGQIAAGAVVSGGAIPEPQTYLLCAAGLLGLSLLGRRNR